MTERPADRVLVRARRAGLVLAAAAFSSLAWTQATQNAVANGDTRTLTLYHTHSKESATITFRRNGEYDSSGLKQLNHFLRDWRNDDETRMDPRLFDVVWAAYRESGSSEPINIVSAYRSPGTNAMLRRRSRAVAENSQHIAGKAMDFFLGDVPMDKVRAIGMRLQQGGVGFYPTSYNPFVHLDVGSVRSWPRMTHDQLVRVFPDGKTVHLPSDGQPLARYEEARAEILARGGAVAGVSTYAGDDGNGGRRKSLWGALFGGDEEDAEVARAPAPARTRVAARAAPAATVSGEDGGTRGTAVTLPVAPAPAPVPRQVAAPPPLPAAQERSAETTNPLARLVAGLTSDEGKDAAARSEATRALAFAPMPPMRPIETAATGSLPLPPVRPLALAALDNPPGADAAAVLLREHTEDAAFVAHVLPPPRPGMAPPPRDEASFPRALEDADPIRAIFASRMLEKVPRRGARVVTPRVAVRPLGVGASGAIEGSGPRLRMAFSDLAAGPDSDRFSGPAVAPLSLCVSSLPGAPPRC